MSKRLLFQLRTNGKAGPANYTSASLALTPVSGEEGGNLKRVTKQQSVFTSRSLPKNSHWLRM